MKKLLALIMVLAMTVCLFAACAEKEEGPKDETADVRPLAEEALELFVKRDVKLYEKFTDPDPLVAPAKNVADKYAAYDAIIADFEAQVSPVDDPETEDKDESTTETALRYIADDELKNEVKEYAKKKADELIYSQFKSDGIQNVNVVGSVISASGKAKVLNTALAKYDYSYANLAKLEVIGVTYPEAPAAEATEEEKNAYNEEVAAADQAVKDAIAVMTIDDLKKVVDAIYTEIGNNMADADVAIQYKKNDKGEWKIGMFSVSVIEIVAE